MTDTPAALFAAHPRIPLALAAEEARRGRDYDEALSDANLSVWLACLRFDPARSPDGSAGPFLVQHARWHMLRLHRLRRLYLKRRAAASFALQPLGWHDPPDHRAGPALALEEAEEAEAQRCQLVALLARLRPRVRAVVLSRLEGLTFTEAGQRLGVTRERARQLFAEAKELEAAGYEVMR